MNDYDALRDYLMRQKQMEFVLSFEQIEEIIDAALPRAANRASWWDTSRSPDIQMPQREACLAAAHVEHDVDANGRKADHRHHGRDDQQFRRNPPRPAGHDFAPSRQHRLLPILLDAPEILRSV